MLPVLIVRVAFLKPNEDEVLANLELHHLVALHGLLVNVEKLGNRHSSPENNPP
jgi:hypothetical protein